MPNPDRTILLDLSAIEEARGPQPNDYFVCLTRREAAASAYAVAFLLCDVGCDVRDCANCNEYRRLFWDLTSELGPQLQRELFASLAKSGFPIPDGPWEEEDA